MKKYDVIIIGAGLAGLSSAAKLSLEGKKVLLLEKHNRVGGLAKNFERDGFLFDGLHMMEGYSEKSYQHRVFKELGILDHVDLVRIKTFFNVHYDDVPSFRLTADPIIGKQELLERFPKEKKAIEKFWSLMGSIKNEHEQFFLRRDEISIHNILFKMLFPHFHEYGTYTSYEYFEKFLNDDFLKIVLGCNLHFFGSSDRKMSFVYYLLGIAHYIFDGCYYIKGSSQILSDHLKSVIESNGGEVLLRHEVENLLLDGNKVSGVQAREVKQKAQTRTFYADFVVANCPINVLLDSLSPGLKETTWGKRFEELAVGPTLTQVHLAFKNRPENLDDRQYMHNMVREDISAGEHLIEKDILEEHSFSFIDYGKIDSGIPDSGNITIHDHLSSWEGLTKKEYREKKDQVAQLYIDRLNEYFPGLKDHIYLYEVTTPLTIKRFTGNIHGAFNGFEQTVDIRSWSPIKPETPYENLFLASQWAFPGGGYPSTLTCGHIVAEKILKKSP